MPELPEVETTLRGIESHIVGQKISDVVIRYPRLRWPIPNLKKYLKGQIVKRVWRRGKYILFSFSTGTLILHLGMSGRLRILSEPVALQKHDHVDIVFLNHKYLRFTDPRRFGALLWTADNPIKHVLLADIGPEPLTESLTGEYLWQLAQNKKTSIKSFLMNSKIIAGVGNIYATEALFQARIRPQKSAGKVKLSEYKKLAVAIKKVLQHAIDKGGTTLRDFSQTDGSPGYFRVELKVYGKGGQPCPRCKRKLASTRLDQRSTVYCISCQH